MPENIRECLVLAGGLGTRLRSVISDRPKALASVSSRPFLSILIEFLAKKGINRFVFSLGFQSEKIIGFLADYTNRFDMDFAIEDEPLGTGGAIKFALQKCIAKRVLVVNADTFLDMDIEAMYAAHLQKGAQCTIATVGLENFSRYGSLEFDNDFCITSFKEKTHIIKGYINGGYILLEKDFLIDYPTPLKFLFEKDFLEKRVHEHKLFAFSTNGYFIDIGIPEDYDKAQNELNFVIKKYLQ